MAWDMASVSLLFPLMLVAFRFMLSLTLSVLLSPLSLQYRGKLEATSVIRAICSAFPAGDEPSLCNGKVKIIVGAECLDGRC